MSLFEFMHQHLIWTSFIFGFNWLLILMIATMLINRKQPEEQTEPSDIFSNLH